MTPTKNVTVYFEKAVTGPDFTCHSCKRNFRQVIKCKFEGGGTFRYCDECAKKLGLVSKTYTHQ